VDEPARRMSAHADQPPVYAYLFSWGAPDAQGRSVMPGNWGRRLGAFHSLEIPFFLGTDTVDGFLQSLVFSEGNAPGRRALSGLMMDYLARFVRTGNPNGDGLPEWTPWTNVAGAPKSIVLDATQRMLAVGMSAEELTDGSVMAAMDAELGEPLRRQARGYLEGSHMPAGVR
jgi:carboxylesterase type B